MMIKIIGCYRANEYDPLKIAVEYKDALWVFFKDMDSGIVYGDFVPVPELDFDPAMDADEDTKEKVLMVILKNKEAIERNIRTFILDEKLDPITREWIK